MIIWPNEPEEAIRLYLKFVLQSLELCNFMNKEALKELIEKAGQFLRAELSLSELNAMAKVWQDFLWDESRIRDFRSNDTLFARLALCIVSIKEEEVSKLNDILSWYLEVLDFLKVDVKPVMKLSEVFFKTSH